MHCSSGAATVTLSATVETSNTYLMCLFLTSAVSHLNISQVTKGTVLALFSEGSYGLGTPLRVA